MENSTKRACCVEKKFTSLCRVYDKKKLEVVLSETGFRIENGPLLGPNAQNISGSIFFYQNIVKLKTNFEKICL